MKTNKNFLKKLAAGILGFVMTLGVGAAGYASAASEIHAADSSVELCTSWNQTFAYTSAYTHDYTIDNLNGGTTTMTLGVQGVYRQSNANTYFQMNKKTGYFKNTTEMPGKITKIETTWSAAKGPTKCYFASNAAATSSDATVTVTAATSVTYTPDNTADYYYFNIDVSTGSGAAQLTSCVVYYESAGQAKTLNSITGIEGTLSAKQADSSFDLSGLIPKGTLSDATSTVVDISSYVTLSTTDTPSSVGAGTHNVSVKVTPKSGSVSAKSFNVSATVLASAIFEDNINDMGVNLSAQQVAENALWNDGDEETAAVVHNLRLSSSEWWESKGSTYSMLGDYSSSGNGAWSKFSANKYFSSIASAITSTTYGFAMYTQNFSVNKPSSVEFDWSAVSGLGGTSNAYIVASSNGGYSWSVLKNVSTLGTNKSISWSGSDYANTNNVILGLAYTSTTKDAQLRNIGITIYGDSLSMTNVWALREITISGSDSVEAEKSITLTGTTVTDGYETPANTGITWSSNNTSVATVDATTGEVTGVSAGTATITATAADGNGASASKTITVTAKQKALSSITLNTDSVTKTFERGSTFNYEGLVVTANYSNGFASETVTPTNVVGPDMSVAGEDKTVTVYYELGGVTKDATYTITITPKVSNTLTITGEGISFNQTSNHYEITTGPEAMVQLTVTKDGDETSYNTATDNEEIYVEEGWLLIESTENDTGAITFSCGNATAVLDVTVVADESYTRDPADGVISGIVGEKIEFGVTLVNVSEAEWDDAPTSSNFEITGLGDEAGYIGEIELLDVCTAEEFTLYVLTSDNEFEITFTVTAIAATLTGIEADSTAVDKDYTLGETFNPTGLVVTATYDNGKEIELNSDDYELSEPNMFEVNSAEEVIVSYGNQTDSFTINVHIKPGITSSYNKISSVADITEGDYIIVYDSKALDGRDAEDGYTSVTISDSKIATGTSTDKLAVHIKPVDGGYTLKTSSTIDTVDNRDKYISFTSGSNGLAFGDTAKTMSISLATSSIFANNTAGTFDIGDSATHLAFNDNTSGAHRFRFYKTSTTSGTGSNKYYPVDLYKKVNTGSYDVIKLSASYTGETPLYEGDIVHVSDFAPISALFNDGSSAKTVTESDGVTITSGNPLQKGDNTVVLSYKGRSCSVAVNGVLEQSKEVDNISMTYGEDAKTAYYLEDGVDIQWDFSDIKITIDYKGADPDEELTIPEAVSKYGATVSPAVPTKGTDGFTVSLTVLGVSLGNDGHFSASVVDKEFKEITALNTGVNLKTEYWEDETFVMAGVTSLKISYNNGDTETISGYDNIVAAGGKIGLFVNTDATEMACEITPSTELDPQYDGYFLGATFGGDVYIKSSVKISITAHINEVSYTDPSSSVIYKLVTSDSELTDGMEFVLVYNTTKVMDELDAGKRYLGADATVNSTNKTVSFSSAKVFKLKANGDKWNILDGDNAIAFTGSSNQDMALQTYDSSSSKQKFTITVSSSSCTLNNVSYDTRGLRYNTGSGYMSNYGSSSQGAVSIYKKTLPKTTYSNTNMTAQHAALDYAKWFMSNITVNATDAQWNGSGKTSATSKFKSMVTDVLTNTDDLANAKALFKYATADASGDDLQKAMAIYDAYIAKYNYGGNAEKNFLDRSVEGTSYTVTLNATENGGTCETTTIQMKYGETYTNLPVATKEGYNFAGWFTSKSGNTPVSTFTGTDNSTVIYAQFKTAYSITLNTGSPDATGGSLSMNSYSVSDKDQEVTVTDPTREGYHVVGYTKSVDNVEFDFESRTLTIPAGKYGQITLTAQWEANDHTATLNYNNGSDAVVIPTKYDGTLDLSEYSPTKDGYYLSGWVDGNGKTYKVDDVIAIKGDMELTAQWTEVTCTIDYSIGYQFTGLDITKFEFIFTGTYEGDNVSGYGFMICKDEATLDACIKSNETSGSGITAFVCTDGEAECVAGVKTTKTDQTYYVVFYFTDDQGTHYSQVIEVCIDEILSDNYDTSSITDEYARAAIEYYIYTLQNPGE